MKGSILSVSIELQKIKEAVSADTISISDLFKSSYRLIKIQPVKLITLCLVAWLVSTVNMFFSNYLLKPGVPSGFFLLYNAVGLLITSFIFVLILSAVLEVYETGNFSLHNILDEAIRKFLKYVWTHFILMLVCFLSFLVLGFIFGFMFAVIGLRSALLSLISGSIFFVFFIWFLVRVYFFPYIIVCNNRHGLSALSISFGLTKGYWWQIVKYTVPITLIISLPLVPTIFLMVKGITLAYLTFIPNAIAALYAMVYGLILYKHWINKVCEGNIRLLTGDKFKNQILELNREISKNPNDARLYDNRGYLYLDVKQYNEAMNDFNKAIELDRKHKDAYVGLAICYFTTCDVEKALKYYNKVITLDKRYEYKVSELSKEGYSYKGAYLGIIKEILEEMHRREKKVDATIYCPFCRTKTRKKKKRCPQCNQDLSVISEEFDYSCSVCGRDIPEKAQYCWNCGEKFEGDKPE